MTSITLAKAVQMRAEFDLLGPPPQVSRAVSTIVTLAACGSRVPHDLIQYVQGWIAKHSAQNRYGK
jgi:hypothetical protein